MVNQQMIAIVGANLAGGRAAESLRDRGFDGRILLIGAEEQPPYERPPLSKQILLGTMADDGPLLRQEAAWADLGIELVLGRTVTELRPHERRLELEDGTGVRADQVLLCTGSRARRLPVDGADLPGVVHLRTLADAVDIADRLHEGASVLVVGGGFIGAEVAGAAVARRCRVTMLEAEARPLSRLLGPELGEFYADAHRRRGVDLRVRTTVERFEGRRRVERAVLSDGTTLPVDVVVVGIGVVPATELAEAAGLALGNGIRVDESCRTSIEGVYAAGDVTDHPNAIFGVRLRLETWQNAQNQALVAAGTMLGGTAAHTEVPWFWSDQHDLKLQVAGLPSLGDSSCVRGQIESECFCVFYLRGGRLVGAVGVNRTQDVRRSSSLIEFQVPVDTEALVDEGVDLRRLHARGLTVETIA